MSPAIREELLNRYNAGRYNTKTERLEVRKVLDDLDELDPELSKVPEDYIIG